jgi:hypothetical protein
MCVCVCPDPTLSHYVAQFDLKIRRLTHDLLPKYSSMKHEWQFSDEDVAALKVIDELYLHALDVYEESSLLRMSLSQYIRIFRANRHIEMLHIASAEVRAYPVLCCVVLCCVVLCCVVLCCAVLVMCC